MCMEFKFNSYICGMKFLRRTWDLYYDGFRSMTLGKTLWAVILVKLFLIFFVLKFLFFPNYIKEHARGNPADFVANELRDMSKTPNQ